MSVVKDFFDAASEETGETERQGQRRIVLACFDGVDRLARHSELVGELALAPLTRFAQLADTIGHEAFRRKPPNSISHNEAPRRRARTMWLTPYARKNIGPMPDIAGIL